MTRAEKSRRLALAKTHLSSVWAAAPEARGELEEALALVRLAEHSIAHAVTAAPRREATRA